MKIKQSQLKTLIKEMFTNTAGSYMTDMGDSKMTPEGHLFYYRGIVPHPIQSAVEAIVDELESMGIELKEDKPSIVNKIILDIRNAVKEEL